MAQAIARAHKKTSETEFFSPCFGDEEFVRGVDAHDLARIVGDDGLNGHVFAVGDFDDVGEVELVGIVVIFDLREGGFEEGHGDAVDADVDLMDGDLLGSAVLKFDDAGHVAVLISDDAAIRRGFVANDGEAYQGFLGSLEHEFFERSGLKVGKVSGEDDGVSCLEGLHFVEGRTDGVGGAQGLGLDGDVDIERVSVKHEVLADGIRGTSHDDNDIFDSGELAGVEGPVKHGAIGDFVERLGLHGMHAFSFTAGQNNSNDIFHRTNPILHNAHWRCTFRGHKWRRDRAGRA